MYSMKDVLKRFSPFFKNYIPYFILAILGMALSSGGTAYSAYLVKPLLDEIFIAKDKEMLQLLPYAIIAVYALKEAGRYMQAYYTAYIGQDIIKHFRDAILENLLKLDLSFFHEYRTGELISRNTNDVERVRTVKRNSHHLWSDWRCHLSKSRTCFLRINRYAFGCLSTQCTFEKNEKSFTPIARESL